MISVTVYTVRGHTSLSTALVANYTRPYKLILTLLVNYIKINLCKHLKIKSFAWNHVTSHFSF